jgi:hypothetical protein
MLMSVYFVKTNNRHGEGAEMRSMLPLEPRTDAPMVTGATPIAVVRFAGV